MSELTNVRIFERELLCSACKRPIPVGDEPQPGECSCEIIADVVEREYGWLEGAGDVKDIHCTRHAAAALVDIDQRFLVHSPTGFEWGYGGSGPADLALNVLALFVDPPEAYRLHQRFKRDVVAKLPREGGVIRARDVRDWLLDRWAAEKAPA
jgi:hypothetical protein